MNGQPKIQLKSSIAYVNIVKELKSKNMKFHTYKSKQEKSFKVVLKYHNESIIPLNAFFNTIKKEIQDLGHSY